MVKKILIIGNSFFPENSPRAFRTTELVKEFARQGHKVTVLIPKNARDHVKFEKKHNVKIKDLGKNSCKEIDTASGGKYIVLLKRMVRRVLNLLFEFPDIGWMINLKRKLKNETGYDLLISIAVPFPIHWGVAWARNKKNRIATIWVADCGDPYYFNSLDSFKKMFYFQYLEKWFSKKADFISIPFEGLKKYFFKEFNDKYRVIPQGFNFDEIRISSEPIKNEVITFAYAGGFIKNKRDPRKFLDLISTIKEPFKFIVYNEQKEFTKPYKAILGDKLIINDYIPRDKLLYELSKMDFLVNFEYDPENQAPSKLIDYSLVKRPILLTKLNDFDEKIIHEFLNKNYKHQFKYDQISKFDIKNVVSQFLELSKTDHNAIH